jgi:hypothetical protein
MFFFETEIECQIFSKIFSEFLVQTKFSCAAVNVQTRTNISVHLAMAVYSCPVFLAPDRPQGRTPKEIAHTDCRFGTYLDVKFTESGRLLLLENSSHKIVEFNV